MELSEKFISSFVDKIRESQKSECNCDNKDDITHGCGGTIRFVENFEDGRFDRNVCDHCGAMISSYGLHLLH